MNLAAARVFVTDIDEAIAFYSGRLGLKVEVADAQRGFCMFDTGATTGHRRATRQRQADWKVGSAARRIGRSSRHQAHTEITRLKQED